MSTPSTSTSGVVSRAGAYRCPVGPSKRCTRLARRRGRGRARETAADAAPADRRPWAGPDEVQIEFGVSLSSQAGAVIAKSEAGCHLKVTVSWHRDVGDTAGPGPRPDSPWFRPKRGRRGSGRR
ncbi:CU044_2847 family protein [Streptomyces uncialis]|uniref:CU044_2847 family protein n=1 Tax=Streptomyces uncialis TaxID=1048205 RepID=UPI003815DCA8